VVAALECETGGILDYRVERNAGAQLLLDTTVDYGALNGRSALADYHEQVEVGLGSVIAPDARSESVDTLQADVGSDVLKPCSDRGCDARHCLSGGCIHERTLTIRITVTARPSHTVLIVLISLSRR
jgi:hypothetical protein